MVAAGADPKLRLDIAADGRRAGRRLRLGVGEVDPGGVQLRLKRLNGGVQRGRRGVVLLNAGEVRVVVLHQMG